MATEYRLPYSADQISEMLAKIENIGESPSSTTQTVSLTIEGWTNNGDGRYKQTVCVVGVTTDTPIVLVDVFLTGTDLNADSDALNAWCPEDGSGPSSQNVTQGNGTLTFYCTVIPSVNIPVKVGVC